MFLDRGVPAAYTDVLDQTVLYYIAREGKTNCVDLFVGLGTSDSNLACRLQCQSSRPLQTDSTLLCCSVLPPPPPRREGHCELAEKLIKMGTEVDAEDNNGQTALFYSAREGQKAICEMLLAHGANVNKQDKKRLTPIHWATKHNRHDVVHTYYHVGR